MKSDNELVIAIFDLETTGIDPARDQIIELSVQKGLEKDAFRKTWRIKPSVPISPEAQAVHGISMEDLQGCKNFRAHSDVFRRIFEKSEMLIGYNLEFDLSFVQAEFRRISQPEIDLREKLLIDPYRLWRKCEPRTLADAHNRFAGSTLEGAHSAEQDVIATGRVLEGMLKAFSLKERNWKDIAQMCGLSRSNWIGPSHHFQWTGSTAVFGFGKHRNRPISEIAQLEDGSYLDWLLKTDFPGHVKQIARAAKVKSSDELAGWLTETFGSGASREG